MRNSSYLLSTPYAIVNGLPRIFMPLECERIMGFPDGWTALEKASDMARYKALGNAVIVPVVEWIGKRF